MCIRDRPVLQVQVVPERVLQVSVVPVPVVLVPVLVPVRHQSEAALGRPDLPEVARFLELEPEERSVEFHMIMTELVTAATEYQITHWQVRAHHVVGWPRGLKLRPKVRGANLCRGTRLSTSGRISPCTSSRTAGRRGIRRRKRLEGGELRKVALRFKKNDIDSHCLAAAFRWRRVGAPVFAS